MKVVASGWESGVKHKGAATLCGKARQAIRSITAHGHVYEDAPRELTGKWKKTYRNRLVHVKHNAFYSGLVGVSVDALLQET